ncbi:MAG: nicotinate-nucleotide adenylyltransferase [Actinomycetota bacterium]|nr:nicotinate-nucleotide adenylyltransferase [Actinomycetota bacterium]
MTAPAAGAVGVYPGSFDPLTVAHIAIAEAAVRAAHLVRIDLALSTVALGKESGAHASVDARADAIRRAARTRPWLAVTTTDEQLIAEIAAGYDVVVMGADKWAQVRDPAWYGGDATARDAALDALPRVLVAPRSGFDVDREGFGEGHDAGDRAEILDIDPEHRAVSSTRARAGESHLVAADARRRVLVDGNNVVGSRPDGWWRDRPGATRRLVAQLQDFARRSGADVAVVFDGRPLSDLPEGAHDGVRVAYARRAGRDAGDDRIVEEVAADDDRASLTVVTSDRGLAQRVRELGAPVESAGALIRELESERR